MCFPGNFVIPLPAFNNLRQDGNVTACLFLQTINRKHEHVYSMNIHIAYAMLTMHGAIH